MKSSTIKTVILTFGTVVWMANDTSAQSQNRQEKKPPTFKELLKDMDKNEDGKLSKSELKGPLNEDFAKVDLDEDGFITAEEFKKAPKPKRRKRD